MLPCTCCEKVNHFASKFKLTDARCHHCSEVGHINAACPALKKATDRITRSKDEKFKTVQESAEWQSTKYTLVNVHSVDQHQPCTVTLEVDEQPLSIKNNTWASFCVFRGNLQTTLATQVPNADYCQAQKIFIGTVGSEGEQDGSHLLWHSIQFCKTHSLLCSILELKNSWIEFWLKESSN